MHYFSPSDQKFKYRFCVSTTLFYILQKRTITKVAKVTYFLKICSDTGFYDCGIKGSHHSVFVVVGNEKR
jgi:hypothetical protein